MAARLDVSIRTRRVVAAPVSTALPGCAAVRVPRRRAERPSDADRVLAELEKRRAAAADQPDPTELCSAMP